MFLNSVAFFLAVQFHPVATTSAVFIPSSSARSSEPATFVIHQTLSLVLFHSSPVSKPTFFKKEGDAMKSRR
jgi:hypothetical protein